MVFDIWRLSRLVIVLWALSCCRFEAFSEEISFDELSEEISKFEIESDESSSRTWWFPDGWTGVVVPESGGVVVENDNAVALEWARRSSPFRLAHLPIFGVIYEDRVVSVVVPWPHYATLVVKDRVGVRFDFPEGRRGATPVEIYACVRVSDSLEVARVFREWRSEFHQESSIPESRTLTMKAEALPKTEWLFGAPHFYLWGPSLFSKHDVARQDWIPFARALLASDEDTFVGKNMKRLGADEREAIETLANEEWPNNYLIVATAEGINKMLGTSDVLGLPMSLDPNY